MPFTSLYGKESILSTNVVPTFDEGGAVNGAIVLIEDITESKEREKALQKSKQNYYELVEGANSVILRMDAIGTITFINRFGEELFGYTKEELVGRSELETIVPEIESTGKNLKEMILDIARNPTKYKINVNENIRKNGERLWILWTNTPIFDDEGRVIGSLCIGNNITELRRRGEVLQYLFGMERLVTTISTNFINLAPDEIDAKLNQALQLIGEFVDVDRSYIYRFSKDKNSVSNTHEWCAKGIESEIEIMKNLPVDAFPWIYEKLSRLEIIHVPSIADLPPAANAEKEFFQLQNLKSLIYVPLSYGKFQIGFFGFDSVRSEKTWSEEGILLLKIIKEIFTNVLTHKYFNEELKASRTYFQNFFDLSPVPLTLIGLDGKRLDCNQAMEELTGRRKEELINVPIEATYAKEEKTQIRKLVNKTIENGSTRGFETYFYRPDGTKLPVVLNCSLLRDEKGKSLSMICATVDMTEFKKRELELKESNEFNRLLIENIPATIVMFDKENKISWVNKEFIKISGWSLEEIIGKRAANMPHSKPPYICESGLPYMKEGSVEALKKIWKSLEKGEIGVGEVPYQTKDGRIVIHRGIEIPYGKGRLWVSVDVTEMKKREGQMKKLIKKYESQIGPMAKTIAKEIEEE